MKQGKQEWEKKNTTVKDKMKRDGEKENPISFKCGERRDRLQGNTDFPHGTSFFCDPSDIIW